MEKSRKINQCNSWSRTPALYGQRCTRKAFCKKFVDHDREVELYYCRDHVRYAVGVPRSQYPGNLEFKIACKKKVYPSYDGILDSQHLHVPLEIVTPPPVSPVQEVYLPPSPAPENTTTGETMLAAITMAALSLPSFPLLHSDPYIRVSGSHPPPIEEKPTPPPKEYTNPRSIPKFGGRLKITYSSHRGYTPYPRSCDTVTPYLPKIKYPGLNY